MFFSETKYGLLTPFQVTTADTITFLVNLFPSWNNLRGAMLLFKPRPYTRLFWRFALTWRVKSFSSWNASLGKWWVVNRVLNFPARSVRLLRQPGVICGVLILEKEFKFFFCIIRCTLDLLTSWCAAISLIEKCVPGCCSCDWAKSSHSSAFSSVVTVIGRPLPGHLLPEPVFLIFFINFSMAFREHPKRGCSCQIRYAVHQSHFWLPQFAHLLCDSSCLEVFFCKTNYKTIAVI